MRILKLLLPLFLIIMGCSSVLVSSPARSPLANPVSNQTGESGEHLTAFLQTDMQIPGSSISEGMRRSTVRPIVNSSPDNPKAGVQTDNNEESETEGEVKIADPLEPFNRAMFQFNDRLYFWVLKPVALQYSKIVPEKGRVSVSNFFNNVKFPIRFVSNLLQANFKGAISELGRFTINTTWGIGGLLDPASKKGLEIKPSDTDLGLTLGTYGVGQGFYIVWPLLGPSSARDTTNLVGDYFLDPLSYLDSVYASIGIRVYNTINQTSLRIGDYESLKEAAIDPYISLRSGYIQYREQKIKQRSSKTTPNRPGGVY